MNGQIGCMGFFLLFASPLAWAQDQPNTLPSHGREEDYVRALKHLTGEGVAQDYEESLQWMLEASMAGYAPAREIYFCLRDGKTGVALGPAPRTFEELPTDPPDLKLQAAFFYWQRSCDPVDTTKAIGLFQELAATGDSRAAYILAVAYRQGRGVIGDLQLAAKWFRRAGSRGHAAARRAFCRLREEVRISGVGNAQRIRDWCNCEYLWIIGARRRTDSVRRRRHCRNPAAVSDRVS